jgi:hypothetical protein
MISGVLLIKALGGGWTAERSSGVGGGARSEGGANFFRSFLRILQMRVVAHVGKHL